MPRRQASRGILRGAVRRVYRGRTDVSHVSIKKPVIDWLGEERQWDFR